MIYYISDTHFKDQKIFDKCKRPFESLDEMEETIIGDITMFQKTREEKLKVGHEAVVSIFKKLSNAEDIKNLINVNQSTFDSIKHVDEKGLEYWYARQLMNILMYSKWSNFKKVICKAKETCIASNYNELEHFTDVGKVLRVVEILEKEAIALA